MPWSRAGYIGNVGIVGPLIVPGETGCQRCLFKDEHKLQLVDLPFIDVINSRYQPPSFGPLNGAVASMQAKEAIFWLLGERPLCKSLSAVITIDFLASESRARPLQADPMCICQSIE
jgi:molybdopterin/thiamine biosynthesis adenylyltransferase